MRNIARATRRYGARRSAHCLCTRYFFIQLPSACAGYYFWRRIRDLQQFLCAWCYLRILTQPLGLRFVRSRSRLCGIPLCLNTRRNRDGSYDGGKSLLDRRGRRSRIFNRFLFNRTVHRLRRAVHLHRRRQCVVQYRFKLDRRDTVLFHHPRARLVQHDHSDLYGSDCDADCGGNNTSVLVWRWRWQ